MNDTHEVDENALGALNFLVARTAARRRIASLLVCLLLMTLATRAFEADSE
jgi:hypothetical protein